MPVTTREYQGTFVLDLVGRFDLESRERVQGILDEVLESGTRHVILNLSGVPFIDSAALGLLVVNHKKFQEAGGRISLVSPQPEVRLLLDMAATPKLIPSYQTLDEAVSAPAAAE